MDRRDASLLIEKGRYRARLALCEQDLVQAQTLRHLAFHGREGRDADAFDALSSQVLVEETQSGALVGCCRFLPLNAGTIS